MKIASVALDVVYGQPERREQLSKRRPWANLSAIDKRACRVEEGGVFIIRDDVVYVAFISFTQFDTYVALVRIRFPYIGYVIWLAQVVLEVFIFHIAYGEAAAARKLVVRRFSNCTQSSARTIRGEVLSEGEAQCALARFDSQSPRALIPPTPDVLRRNAPPPRPKVRDVPEPPQRPIRQTCVAPMLRAARQRQRVGRPKAGQHRAHELRQQLVEILALRAGLHLRTTTIPSQARVPEQASR